MNGKKNLKSWVNNYRLVALDTNIFIYYFDKNSPFYKKADQLFSEIILKELEVATSIITLAELLSFQTDEHIINQLEIELATMPKLKLVDVNYDIAAKTAVIRRTYGFSIPDALQLATALFVKADTFITNDAKLKRFKELPVRLL